MTSAVDRLPGSPEEGMAVRVDGVTFTVPAGVTILGACDQAGAYVPRLCTYPGRRCASCAAMMAADTASDLDTPPESDTAPECGLCVVRLGTGEVVLACQTTVENGMQIGTDDEQLRKTRLDRMRDLLEGHPFVCLLCPDRDGCSRDECSYGNPREARCCDLRGSCELEALLGFVDPEGDLRPGSGPFAREAVDEGPIRRESGLCIGCGRCVVVCEAREGAQKALLMVAAAPDPRATAAPALNGAAAPAPRGVPRALPRAATLRASGCTFCGRCVLVCPTGALTPSGKGGAGWLERRRQTSGLAPPVLPPRRLLSVAEARIRLGTDPGVLELLDDGGEVLLIAGVPDLTQGLERALRDLSLGAVEYVRAEVEPLYTQRESELLTLYTRRYGRLPRGNDLGDDLYEDGDLFADEDDP